MAAKSKNKYDVFNWIKDKVIPSIQNYQQSLTCEKLIDNFDRMYIDRELTNELNTIHYFKYDNI
jgi:hypothetical protein